MKFTINRYTGKGEIRDNSNKLILTVEGDTTKKEVRQEVAAAATYLRMLTKETKS